MWSGDGAVMHTSGMTEPTDDPGMLGGKNLPMCPLCGNATFRREEGKFDSAWGLTAHPC
jgi:hypothetical protein